jgi:peptide deformylase
MARLKIYSYPDAVLTQKALPIARIDKSYRKIADDMFETMYAAPGIGLAANQVGILERIVVLDVEYDFEELEGQPVEAGAEVFGNSIVTNRKPIILLNPEIIRAEGKTTTTEGCLSVPEYTAEVQRSKRVSVQYQDLDGLSKTLDAEGLLAVAIQHELDHLDGKIFVDRLSPLKKEMAQKKLKKERAEREAQGVFDYFEHDLMDPREARSKGF